MARLKELRALAKDYGILGRSKLKKNDLIKAIAEAHTADFIKRLWRAQLWEGFPPSGRTTKTPTRRVAVAVS